MYEATYTNIADFLENTFFTNNPNYQQVLSFWVSMLAPPLPHTPSILTSFAGWNYA